jgi:hypothetical protein
MTRLHEYLGGAVNGLDGITQGAGGVADHVHLLVGLKSTHCLADFMRELKKASSVWVRDEVGKKEFVWQEGYGAFTVSASATGFGEILYRKPAPTLSQADFS